MAYIRLKGRNVDVFVDVAEFYCDNKILELLTDANKKESKGIIPWFGQMITRRLNELKAEAEGEVTQPIRPFLVPTQRKKQD